MPGKRSKSMKTADLAAAKEAAYKYLHNPFEEGTRIWKMCEKARAHKAAMDLLFDEMEEIYGPAGIKKPVINNIPGTFLPAPTTTFEVKP